MNSSKPKRGQTERRRTTFYASFLPRFSANPRKGAIGKKRGGGAWFGITTCYREIGRNTRSTVLLTAKIRENSRRIDKIRNSEGEARHSTWFEYFQ